MPANVAEPSESQAAGPESDAWRNELSARLNRYRARRKIHPPRYPSLSLQFGPMESVAGNPDVAHPAPPSYELVSDHALALDGMTQEATPESSIEVQVPPTPSEIATRRAPQPEHPSAKIIEFPRFAWGPPPPPPDQLAEPVGERPRILEVPDTEAPLPALGGITIEGAERQEVEKRPGIDIPLQSASLSRRLLASVIDGLIIAVASALFAFVFWKVAGVRPPQIQVLGLAAGIPVLLWICYQYLLIVYAATTPGLRLAGLELTRFDGSSTSRTLRRWRVLASCLSAVSLGMGYAWVFLDEDALCWHDRITHTYLAPRYKTARN
jgi:uncharacterized RDD family membrane protein YckC